MHASARILRDDAWQQAPATSQPRLARQRCPKPFTSAALGMRHFISTMLVVVGIIHLLPLSGVLGAERLAALYGISVAEPNLEILMRHRAVLFGLLGLFLIHAAFRPPLQLLALVAGAVSVISFLWLAWSVKGYNELVGRVVMADIAAAICLVLAGIARAHARKQG